MEKIKIPILLVAFNRPHCVKKVMQQLREIKPEVIYFSVDAGRDNKPDDVPLVEEVKRLVKQVDWQCDVYYHFHSKNVGAEVNVSSAVRWVLQHHEYVIVNEDDIYAGYSFYKFVQDMLIRYKDDNRIGIVGGFNNVKYKEEGKEYFFSKSVGIWGWGTWKRVWDSYKLDDEIEDKYIAIDYLKRTLCSKENACYVHRVMKHQQSLGKGNNTWDYIFWYFRLKHDYLGIMPAHNLISNIGAWGLHGNGYCLSNFCPYDSDFKVTHFREVKWDKDYDEATLKQLFCPPLFRKIYNKFLLKYRRIFVYNSRFMNKFYNS